MGVEGVPGSNGAMTTIVQSQFLTRHPCALERKRSSPTRPPHLQYGLETLRQQGVPVEGLAFDSQLVIRGLIMDKDKGNLIKVDRFG